MNNYRVEVGFGSTNEIICDICGFIAGYDRNESSEQECAYDEFKKHECAYANLDILKGE